MGIGALQGISDRWFSRADLCNRQGIILRPGRLSSIVEVKRINGPIFNSKEAAEEHALQLCKEWIDKRLDPLQPTTLDFPDMCGRFTATFEFSDIRSAGTSTAIYRCTNPALT